jgi:hypothetical protein
LCRRLEKKKMSEAHHNEPYPTNEGVCDYHVAISLHRLMDVMILERIKFFWSSQLAVPVCHVKEQARPPHFLRHQQLKQAQKTNGL